MSSGRLHLASVQQIQLYPLHLGEHLQEYQLQGGRHSENSQQNLPCLVIRKMCAAGERAERARKTEEETLKNMNK